MVNGHISLCRKGMEPGGGGERASALRGSILGEPCRRSRYVGGEGKLAAVGARLPLAALGIAGELGQPIMTPAQAGEHRLACQLALVVHRASHLGKAGPLRHGRPSKMPPGSAVFEIPQTAANFPPA